MSQKNTMPDSPKSPCNLKVYQHYPNLHAITSPLEQIAPQPATHIKIEAASPKLTSSPLSSPLSYRPMPIKSSPFQVVIIGRGTVPMLSAFSVEIPRLELGPPVLPIPACRSSYGDPHQTSALRTPENKERHPSNCSRNVIRRSEHLLHVKLGITPCPGPKGRPNGTGMDVENSKEADEDVEMWMGEKMVLSKEEKRLRKLLGYKDGKRRQKEDDEEGDSGEDTEGEHDAEEEVNHEVVVNMVESSQTRSGARYSIDIM